MNFPISRSHSDYFMQENSGIDIKSQQRSGVENMENANTKSVSGKIQFSPSSNFHFVFVFSVIPLTLLKIKCAEWKKK
jgi:hypothetical protein